MPELNTAALESIGRAVPVPTYDRSKVTTGIVHFGVGGFHRAHQAMYLDALMNQGKALDWGICGVGVMPFDARMHEVMTKQDCLYTLVLKDSDGSWEPRVIGSIVQYLFAPDDPEAVIEKMADPGTRIVSMTVTEGGYNFHHVTGKFDETNPAVAADLQPGAVPGTTFGLITEALVRRRARGTAPFTIMSCDNIQGNGHVAKEVFTAFARLREERSDTWRRHQPRARRLGRIRGALPELDGGPDHPGDHGRGPGGDQRAVRRPGRLAGGLRAVHPVGAGGPASPSAGHPSRTSASRSSMTSSRTS